MTPIQASKKSNEKAVFDNPKNNREIQNPKFQLGDLVRTSDIRKVLSKGDNINYSYEIYTITQTTHDTITGYKLSYKPERYSQNLILPTKLPLDEINQVMKDLNLIQYYNI